MSDHLPNVDIVKRLRDPVNNWNSGGRFEAANEIVRLREDLRRAESARVAILAENTHYKQRAADLERKFSPRRWGKAESDAWNRAIPDVNKAFADLLAAQQTPWLPETTPEAVTVHVPVDWSKAVPINLRYRGQDRTSETTGDASK